MMPPPDDDRPVGPDVPADGRPPLHDATPAAPPLPPLPAAFPAADDTPADPLADAPAPAIPPPPPDLSPRPFRFTGRGGEYFRIWIVNVALSVVTLGIYSAWAKVRRLRYFYGHTSVDGGTFGYHASPIAILKGRLLAYCVVIVFAILSEVAPLAASALYFPLAMVAPIVIVRAFRFRAANSSYRGIRFGFDGMESEAYRVFLFLPLTVPFTIGLAYPFMVKRQREFFVADSRFGRSSFALDLPTARVYGIYVMAALVLFTAIVAAAVTAGGELRRDTPEMSASAAMMFLGVYAVFLATAVGVRTAFENLVWNHTRLEPHHFESRLKTRTMLWLYASNIVAIIATFGLYVPWARVRLARYRAESLTLVPGGPLVVETALGGAEDAASAAELSEAMDLDFGL